MAELGKLPTGYFEVREKDGSARVTAAVVAKTAPSENTPIALDAAMSWFYPDAATDTRRVHALPAGGGEVGSRPVELAGDRNGARDLGRGHAVRTDDADRA